MIDIKLKKGFDLNLYGETEELFVEAAFPERVALKPTDFIGIKPKLAVSVGQKVKVGTELFYDKNNESIKFTSPASGVVEDIVRGERRVLEAVIIKTDGKQLAAPLGFPKKGLAALSGETILALLLKSGLFPLFKQRPFAKVANPEDTPRDIFISTMDTAPLTPDNNMLIDGNEEAFQTGLDAIAKLTSGKVYLAVNGARDDVSPAFTSAKGVELCRITGPHPAGNVGVQIHHIAPIKNRNDIVWTCPVSAVVRIGRLFLTGKLAAANETVVAVAGSSAKGRAYYRTVVGASLDSFLSKKNTEEQTRYISGDVLTGKKVERNGFVGFYDSLVTIIPEPDPLSFDFLGWALPGFEKFSRSMTYLSNYIRFGNKFIQRATKNGSRRPFIATGIYEQVLPMDIYPIFLLKSIYGGDIEEMEGLGIYELAEEDLALCEYIDPSKNNIQDILRTGLDLVEKEG